MSKNLRQSLLPTCQRCTNRDERNENSEDGICKNIQSNLDKLPIRCVGEWANDKIHWLINYFDIFSMGMKNRWSGDLRYIELCSGPGRCSTRDGHEQDGTALAIINHVNFTYLRDAIFIDYNDIVVQILNQRIKELGKSDKASATLGDYNKPESIVKAINSKPFHGLTLCLIDPTDCSIPFSTIIEIYKATNKKCDFIISFFDKVDFHRNGANAILKEEFSKAREKYIRFLGNDSFFSREDVIEFARNKNHNKLSELFKEEYIKSFHELGLRHHDEAPVGDIYKLIFFSAHPTGLKFWTSAKKYDRYGQAEFNLGDNL